MFKQFFAKKDLGSPSARKKKDKEDWSIVYTTQDPWEAEVFRSALLSEDIRATVGSTSSKMERLDPGQRRRFHVMHTVFSMIFATIFLVGIFWPAYLRYTIVGCIGTIIVFVIFAKRLVAHSLGTVLLMVFASVALVSASWPAYLGYIIVAYIITIVIFIVCLFALGEISQAFRDRIAKTFLWWRDRQNVVSVPASKVAEAQMVIRRTSVVMSKKEDVLAEQEEQEKLASQATVVDSQAEQPVVAETKRAGEPVLLAEKDDVGKIFHYEADDKYELRLEMEFYRRSHFMPGEEWEEFIDFSAQRQEFFILLKERYPELAALLKEHKMRPSFLRLIEYSYGKSQPPKKK